ncbi:MAG: Gfo/Idh/MocA family oxidoreductase, partial [Pseudomonadales bacterium]|nr:Gfo/Idh/MocA family oxidoreductase [Pseudomonadales bacterium]
MSKSELKFAVVGCGNIGTRHIGHVENLAELAAICDNNPNKLEKFSNSTARKFENLTEMLAEMSGKIDVVSICTPNGLHAEHTIAALRAGFHVLCEKPMALSSEDCGEMIKVAEQMNRRLFVVKQNRYNPPIVAVKELIDQGALGKIYSAHLNCFWNRNAGYYENSWKGSNDLDGGCLYTQFSHFIDLLYWMVGDVRDALAMVDNFNHQDLVEYEDSGVVALRFNNGA